MKNSYQPIIGLEVHVELATNSKMFCGCPADHFGVTPNTHTCPVCLGLPGALPVPNKKAVEWTMMLGLALGCKINENSKFDRKNYFYPDLSKGYQISQYDEPIAVDGKFVIPAPEPESRQIDPGSPLASGMTYGMREIRIRRVHIEEDTGKLQHTTLDGPSFAQGSGGVKEDVVLIDFNRSGVPLVEIVTEPDFRTLEEVDVYLKKLQQIIRYLGISNADMEKGSMRLEPSISLRKDGEEGLPNYRVELKNINSFRFARKALEYEIKRQSELLDKGEVIKQQTRGWDDVKGVTVPQREKEEANDYRYFPEPDIPPMKFSKLQIEGCRSKIGELPDEKIERFVNDYSLSEYDATILCETRELANYYEKAVSDGADQKVLPKTIANWIINKKIEPLPEVPGELVALIAKGLQITAISDDELAKIIDEVIAANAKIVQDYRSGKEAAIGGLIGQMLKKGSFDKGKVIEILKIKLNKS